MFPVIKVLGKAVSADLVFMALGILGILAVWFALGRKYDFKLKNMGFALLFVIVGSIIGGSLFYVALNYNSLEAVWNTFKVLGFKDKLSYFANILSGNASLGGFLGALLSLRIYTSRFSKEQRKTAMDIFGASAALYHFITKIGCFCMGCCYGIPFKYGLRDAEGVKRVPVALLEAYLYLVVFLLILKFFNTKKFVGRVNFIYLFNATILSFGLEYLRGDRTEAILIDFTVNQIICVAVFLIPFFFFIFHLKSTFKDLFRSEQGILPTNKNFFKAVLYWIITFGFYGVVVMSSVSKNINRAAKPFDNKKTMHFCVVFYLLGLITLGIAFLVWYYKLTKRVEHELNRRNINYLFTKGDFWLWKILGVIVIIGPFVYLHKLFKAINLINQDHNKTLEQYLL